MPQPKKNVVVKKSQDNAPEIYVYGYITEDMANTFAQELNALAQSNPLVKVRINTKGGSVYDGIAMFNCIRNAKCTVDIYVDGVAMSMGSAFIQAANKRYASKYARIMTHQARGGATGGADELRLVADEMDDCNQTMLAMYVNKTGKSENEVKALFLNGKDNFFSAQEALALGLIDGIYDGEQIELPADAEPTAVYDALQMRIEAIFNETEHTMKQIIMPLAVWAKLQQINAMAETASEHEITAAFNKVWDKAQAHDQVKAKLTQKETELATLEKKGITDQVTAMITGAFDAKKITAKQKDVFARQYAEDPEGLKEVLDSMGAFVSVTAHLNQSDKSNGEISADIQAQIVKGWDTLMKEDALRELKAQNEEAYNQVYKKKFGYEPNAKPDPKKTKK